MAEEYPGGGGAGADSAGYELIPAEGFVPDDIYMKIQTLLGIREVVGLDEIFERMCRFGYTELAYHVMDYVLGRQAIGTVYSAPPDMRLEACRVERGEGWFRLFFELAAGEERGEVCWLVRNLQGRIVIHPCPVKKASKTFEA